MTNRAPSLLYCGWAACLPRWRPWGNGAISRRVSSTGCEAYGPPVPETVLVAVLIVATLLLRVIDIGRIPYILSGDEASMGLEAVQVLNGQLRSPFTTGWLSHPTLFFFVQALFLRVGGTSVAVLRLPSALIATAAALLLYLLARRWYGRRIALFALVFYAGYHYAIHFGRIALNNIWDPFFALAALWSITRGLDTRRPLAWGLGGLAMGLGAYFYMGARLVPMIVLAYGIMMLIQRPAIWREQRANILLCIVVAAMAAAPLLFHFRRYPSDLTARWNAVSIFPMGWVTSEMAITGRTMASLLWEQFAKSFFAFVAYPDTTLHYFPQTPLYLWPEAALAVLGLGMNLRNWRKPQYAVLPLWYMLVVLFGGMLLENPPQSPRLVLALPVACCGFPLGWRAWPRSWGAWSSGRARALTVAALVVMLAVSGNSANFYLAKYTPTHVYGGENTEVADALGHYLADLGPDVQWYFYAAPRMFVGFSTITFLAPNAHGTDAPETVTTDMSWADPPGDAVFVFLPERAGELARCAGELSQWHLVPVPQCRRACSFHEL